MAVMSAKMEDLEARLEAADDAAAAAVANLKTLQLRQTADAFALQQAAAAAAVGLCTLESS
jgi:Holliday junction resolvase-like predicted endonuclease